ncbi:MAG: hypothetical protein LBS11_05020 [Oscillospiraceae bacterium]|jgi:hypothetical protein|nr:hypothetical protein [Oscillospiraceae bacterium]
MANIDFNQSGTEGFQDLMLALLALGEGDTLTIYNSVTDWTNYDPTVYDSYCAVADPPLWCTVSLPYSVTIQGLPDVSPRVAIGSPTSPLNGALCSDIYNITFKDLDVYTKDAPLVGGATNMIIKNVDIYVNAQVDGDGTIDACREYFGAVACSVSDYLYADNCNARGAITVVDEGMWAVGGLFGKLYDCSGEIVNCGNYADITSGNLNARYLSLGGIVGNGEWGTSVNFPFTFDHCSNAGGITKSRSICTGGAGDAVGGIVGITILGGGTQVTYVTFCENTGSLTGSYGVAGIVGVFATGEGIGNIVVSDCVNRGRISGEFGVGGIVGSYMWEDGEYRKQNVGYCENTGHISGAYRVGGIVGNASWYNIYQCVNRNTVETVSAYLFPSVCGYNDDLREDYPFLLWLGAGGIAGCATDCYIADCLNTGLTQGLSDYGYGTGGIVGIAYSLYGDLGPEEGYESDRPNNTILRCVNNGKVRYGGWVGGIAGCAFGLPGTYGRPFTVKDCVNRGYVRGLMEGAGGIVGYALGEVWVTGCRVCASAGFVTAGDFAGGVVGMVVYDQTVADAFKADRYGSNEGNVHRVQVSYNMVNLNQVSAVYMGGGMGLGVHRIVGIVEPLMPEPDQGQDETYGIQLWQNSANPGMLLTGDNTQLLSYDTDEGHPLTDDMVYNNSAVKPGDPSLGAYRQNGEDIACQEGALNDCAFCAQIGICPAGDEAAEELNGGDACEDGDYPCNPDFMEEISVVLDAIGRMRLTDARYLLAQRARNQLTGGAGYSPSIGATIPPDPMDTITETERALARGQCCAARFLQCCCENPPPLPCVLCMQGLDSITGLPMVNGDPGVGPTIGGVYEMINLANGDVQYAEADGNAIARFKIPGPGEYEVTMVTSAPGFAIDPAVYLARVGDPCEITVTVKPVA